MTGLCAEDTLGCEGSHATWRVGGDRIVTKQEQECAEWLATVGKRIATTRPRFRSISEAIAAAQRVTTLLLGPDDPLISALDKYNEELRQLIPGRTWDRQLTLAKAVRGSLDSLRGALQRGLAYDPSRSAIHLALGNMISLAQQAAIEGHDTVAGVLASGALETVLKRIAAAEGLPKSVQKRSMPKVLDALAGRMELSELDEGRRYVEFRNAALHAQSGKFDKCKDQLPAVIAYVERLNATHFPP